MVMYTLEQRWQMGLRSTYRICRFWQKKIIFSDEAHFELVGYVNKQNCCIWGIENPHPKRVTVWCRIWSRDIIRPFFFKNKQGEDVTVNGNRGKMHGQPRQPFEWSYFPLLTARIVLSNKTRNLRKYSVVFFKAFSKRKRYLEDPIFYNA